MSGQPRRLACLGCKDRDAIIIRLESMHHANIYEYVTNRKKNNNNNASELNDARRVHQKISNSKTNSKK